MAYKCKEKQKEFQKQWYLNNKIKIKEKNIENKNERQIYLKNHNRTFKGWMTNLYSNMRSSSKRRGMNPPDFSKNEFENWLLNQEKHFNKLWNNWINSGYEKDFVPSVDRLDDNKSYTFNNIQLITWKENDIKGKKTRKKDYIGEV